MKRIFTVFACALFSALTCANTWNVDINQQIRRVDPTLNIGVSILDITTGMPLFKRHDDRSYIPASNMKLFSTAAALMILGPDYRFKTTLNTFATEVDKGTLKGSVIIHFASDPSLTHEQLNRLLAQLKQWGIHRIKGDLILSSLNRTIAPYPPGWSKRDLKFSYGAPVAPLMLDENRVQLTVNPAFKANAQAIVELSSKNTSFKVINLVTTKALNKGCGVDFKMKEDNSLTVTGCIGLQSPSIVFKLAVINPVKYTKKALEQQLQALDIKLDGQIRLADAPINTNHSFELAKHQSITLSELIAHTLKHSDNLYADALYLHAAHHLQEKPVNWIKARSLLKAFLQKETHIDLNRAVLADGSGLSRDNRLTPKQTVDLLYFFYNRFYLAYEYIAALPRGGLDGTLYKRFRNLSQKGLVRAKTGSMTGVVSLSGYLLSKEKHIIAFTMFINGKKAAKAAVPSRSRSLIDALCARFIDYRSKTTVKEVVKNDTLSPTFQETAAEKKRKNNAQWRHLESMIKKALVNQPITIRYRTSEIVLEGNSDRDKRIVQTLKNLHKAYPFSLVFEGETTPLSPKSTLKPYLWIKTNEVMAHHHRWTIKPMDEA